jgi:FAD/FMN-containing dehydrogenase
MGAENLLEATLATPNGTLLTANACRNPDLYYAIRGGGGGTFSIILSATMEAFLTPRTTSYTLQISLDDGDKTREWWDLMAWLHSEFPRLKDAGVQGYYGMFGPPVQAKLSFGVDFITMTRQRGRPWQFLNR